MSKNKSSKKQITARVLFWVGLVLLMVGLGVGARLLQLYFEEQGKKQNVTLEQRISDIQKSALNGDSDGAHKAIDDALNKQGIADSEKQMLLLQQGVTYMNQKEYDKAIESYKAASAISETEAMASAIAKAAEAKGDIELAKSYYQKALGLVSENDPVKESSRAYYQYKIDNLGKSQ